MRVLCDYVRCGAEWREGQRAEPARTFFLFSPLIIHIHIVI